MLEVRNLSSHYGKLRVLRDFSLALAPGEVLGLLGRNGAGKTTALKTIMGLIRPSGGSVRLDGVELSKLPAHRIPKHGLAYVPQGRRLFCELTVAENLRIGLLAGKAGRRALGEALDLFPALHERMGQHSGSLSGGEQQMLAIARALCAGPKVLLMDEPTEGLMPSMIAKVMDTVAALRERGVAVILVEQRVEAALGAADRVAFIDHGTVRETATPQALRADPAPLYRHVGVGLPAS